MQDVHSDVWIDHSMASHLLPRGGHLPQRRALHEPPRRLCLAMRGDQGFSV